MVICKHIRPFWGVPLEEPCSGICRQLAHLMKLTWQTMGPNVGYSIIEADVPQLLGFLGVVEPEVVGPAKTYHGTCDNSLRNNRRYTRRDGEFIIRGMVVSKSLSSSMDTTGVYVLTLTTGVTLKYQSPADPVSYSLLRSFDYLYYPVCFAINVFDTAANVANLVAFHKMGLKDVVNFSFFILALSDFSFSVLTAFVIYGGFVMLLAFPGELWATDIYPFAICFMFYSVVFKDTTVVITAYIAVARCCLVALPLQFKSIFTSGRNRGILVAIVILVTLLHLPLFFTQGVAWRLDPRTNTTRVYMWMLDSRQYTLEYNDIVNKNIVPNTSLAVIIISLVIMSIKLSAASKFRNTLTSKGHDQENILRESDNVKKRFALTSGHLSKKDVRVVKAVCSVAGLYVFSTLPLVFQSLARLIVLDFNFGKRLNNTYNLVLVFTSIVGNFNSAFNFFLYYKYNSKFRNILIAGCLSSVDKETK
ncbi:hypothetical protein Btru_021198 [Bulinus truncatus]|nr:hypothetical protein Btru_021198 [Bulinus truncatus]